MNPHAAVKWVWIAFGAFWLLAAFAQKRSVRRQSASSRLTQIAVVLVALAAFYIARDKLGVLQRHFVPNAPATQYFGVLLLVLGLGFSVWARFMLGRNWSGMVTVKENHVLITRGPYAWVRHPIYTGMLLALFGTAVVGGTLIGLLFMAVATLVLWLKLRTEERFMLETFGEQYRAYRQRVKALIPYIV